MRRAAATPRNDCRHPPRRAERGVALLALVLLGMALASAVAALSIAMGDSARELRTRSDVLCARYAALGALEAGLAADNRPALISARVQHLSVQSIRRNPTWCVLRATARCGSAVRSAERTRECAR